MWRLHIVLVPPTAQDAITFLDANMNKSDTSQSAFPILQYNENIIMNSSNNNDNNSSAASTSSQKATQASNNNSFLNHLPNCKKFLHFTNGNSTLLELSNEILLKFDKLYPYFNEPIEIISLRDRNGCDLDSQFIIKDVFESDGVVLVILKNELDWSKNEHVSLLQLARQRKRPNNKLSVESVVSEGLSSKINKDAIHLVTKNSLKKNFTNRSRVSTPLTNEILPLASKHDALNKEKSSIRPPSILIASDINKHPQDRDHAKGNPEIYEGDSDKENMPSLSIEEQKKDDSKSNKVKNPDNVCNSSEKPCFELPNENSSQISYDSIDTDFRLSTTSFTNADMHTLDLNTSSVVYNARKSSLETKVQNKKSEDLRLNGKNRSENYRRIETFSEEEDLYNTDNDHADSFVNSSKKALVGFRDINSDFDGVSFNSDIEDAVQSTQATKSTISPSFSSINSLHQNKGKEDLFRLVENEFPDKSLSDPSSKLSKKGVKIKDTIRKLNRFKPYKETKIRKNNTITEPCFKKFAPMTKIKGTSKNSGIVHLDTKHPNGLHGILSRDQSAKVGRIKVKRKIGGVESKVVEFKRKKNMENKSLKDIFANTGESLNTTSVIKVVKLKRDTIANPKEEMEAISDSALHTQNSLKVPIKGSAPRERENGRVIPLQFKKVKIARSHSSSSSSSSVSLESLSESSSSDDSDDNSNSRNVQVKKINFRTSNESAGSPSGQLLLDVDGNKASSNKYQTPRYVESDEGDE